MNKSEKLICILLGLFLCWWVWDSISSQRKAAEEYARQQAAVKAQQPAKAAASNVAASPSSSQAETAQAKKAVEEPQAPAVPDVPETLVTLSNKHETVTLSTWGAVVKKVTLKDYQQLPGEPGEKNPDIVLDFSANPMMALSGVSGIPANALYEIKERTEDSVTFANAAATRKITLKPNYIVELEESFASPQAAPNGVSLGVVQLGSSKNDGLSVDSMPADPAAKGKVVHYSDEDNFKQLLNGGSRGLGCGCSQANAPLPPVMNIVSVPGSSRWIAIKNRFFTTALVNGDQSNSSFTLQIRRNEKVPTYSPMYISANAQFGELPAKRVLSFYAGPKKQRLLWDLGMKDVMEFGMWRWLCYPIVAVLNFFYSAIPNYGVAIILLTILVRVLLWPLTHKSTIGMRKMQEIQPLVKEIQSKYKDNPQRLQQETWALYKEHKINPLSSCLPMLVQIPVFIALFTVLRSAVELRYAPFLWITDLSEPEALFANVFPFSAVGGLNILPILMAATMGLQSAFTPSSGDARQQRMMSVFMPLLMLFMFYSFPSALSLYWFLSNIISIAQTWWIRKKYGAPAAASSSNGGVEVVDMPHTRQMRRHQDK